MTRRKETGRTLFLSIISLVLSVSMLVGTTMAWFTDTVNSGVNQIMAGNLDIELEFWNGSKWIDADDNSEILNPEALWEPGYTEVVYLRLRNAGTLELNYNLGVNIVSETSGINKAGETFLLSDSIYFDVAEDKNGEENPYATREAAMEIATEENKISSGYSKAHFLAPDDVKYLALVVYMPTSVGNEANYMTGTTAPKIELGINLIATQNAIDPEYDSWDETYDKGASITVAPGEDLAAAIAQVEEGGILFLENGTYDVASGPIVIEGNKMTIIGMGEVTINKNFGSTHLFTVKNGADVTFKNITMNGQGNTREGIYVRWNSVVTLEDVIIKNTGGSDIMIDEASDAAHGEETASYVWLRNSHIEDVAMCASPVTTVEATQNTYVYFNYDADSTVGSIDVQSINTKPENIIINGVESDVVGTTKQLYVSNDAELAAALNTINTNSDYWNKNVFVYMAAGEYSGNHEIKQYPLWNGEVGAGGSANNYGGGVPAGDPGTVITFVGETASTYARTAAPAVVFTGNLTVKGFGNAGTGFGTATAVTKFENVAFDAEKSIEDNGEDAVALYVKAAANNVTFAGCTFVNATHITLGDRGSDSIGAMTFTGCTFNNGGCLSGYVETLNVTDSVVTAADNGFINKSKAGAVMVENCEVSAGKYFIRTSNSGVTLTVTDSKISMYEAEGKRDLVYFRGSDESATFKNCEIASGWTMTGVDGNSKLEITNESVTDDGLKLVTDGVTNEVSLSLVPADYEGTTVNVPEGVTTIGGYAFAYNSNVEKIVLPSTVTKLNDRAFRDTSASTVVLNKGLTNISYQAFRNATNVKNVEIPSSVTTISKEAFQNSGITTLVVPANVTTIEYGAMRDMKELETVTIEGNVDIPVYAFRACTNLKTVILTGDDVTFGGGSRGMIFTNKENGDGSAITIYVENDTVKERLMAADTAAKDYGGYKIFVGAKPVITADEMSAALTSANTVVLMNDINATAGITIPDGVTLNGNGHTITYVGTDYTYHLVKLSTDAKLENVNLENYRVKTEDNTNGIVTLQDVVISMDNDQTGLDISKGTGVAKLTNVKCKGITDVDHLNPETQVQVDYTPYGDVLLGGAWALEATNCEFGSLHGWNTRNGSSIKLTNTTCTVFRMHYWSGRTLYINGVETAWSESGAIPVAHDVGGCWSVQPAFK